MFDILEADIVVLQEVKIQRKDLTDDMVLVPGWDCFFSLPRHKKGYSGVAIYTRQSKCAPIRAEEGVSGCLSPPNCRESFCELAPDQRIGGYPTPEQFAGIGVDAKTLDSEGRCLLLEFSGFVLIGVYSPANRDESRDEFRLGFLGLLDARIRNLHSMGKNVILTGDINISRDEIDSAHADSSIRKSGISREDYISAPSRRLFNHLIYGGRVIGDRDPPRPTPILSDLCRVFHPDRSGMFTCWEQKVNARPANCGARIDYVLCSKQMESWFAEADIQAGLMGSDHCPVYAIFKDTFGMNSQVMTINDIVRPSSFEPPISPDVATYLPLSGRQWSAFSGRRDIRDMFKKTKSIPAETTESPTPPAATFPAEVLQPEPSKPAILHQKRGRPDLEPPAGKKAKTAVTCNKAAGQQTLKGFFDRGAAKADTVVAQSSELDQSQLNAKPPASASGDVRVSTAQDKALLPHTPAKERDDKEPGTRNRATVDPEESQVSWSKLFSRPPVPRCEGHNEPCVCLLTKKPGVNLGRSFWMCARPLGPSGAKEKGTEWRCQTFVWCSDLASRGISTTFRKAQD